MGEESDAHRGCVRQPIITMDVEKSRIKIADLISMSDRLAAGETVKCQIRVTNAVGITVRLKWLIARAPNLSNA